MVPTQHVLSSVQQRIVNAVAAGQASTRVDLAKHLTLAPSTVSVKVQELIVGNILSESGAASSRGGRRATILRVKERSGHLLVAELGSYHVRLGLTGLTGTLEATVERPIDITDSPGTVLDTLVDYFHEFTATEDRQDELKGICIGLPGPVNLDKGRVEFPSRMPGWNQYPVADELSRRVNTVVMLENDANLMALGEHCTHPNIDNSLTVKAGTGIGSGLVIAGRLFHGATGAAGDLSHARFPGGSNVPCACGNTGCLEAIASGAALIRQLRRHDYDVSRVSQVIDLARDGDATATTLVRDAGRSLGTMLCPIIGFINPEAIFLGGQLSSLAIFVASVRSQLYDGCHPLVTKNLLIAQATSGSDAPLIGAAHLLSQELMTVTD